MSDLITGKTGDWEVVIGMEVHAQVSSNSKLFSGSSTSFGAGPNENVSLVDAAMPGMLPVINSFCIEQAIKTGLGLNAKINLFSVFDRKNYFYADLPQGYQISQYKNPIVGEGQVEIESKDGKTFKIGIERLHLEQDAGKSLHDQHPSKSYIDLNRSGIALMEIVSKPDLRSSFQAGQYMKKLRSILRYLETCDGNMEQGSLRADVNVSVRKPGEKLGIRTETKNLNSIKFIMQAIDYEVERQIEVLENGGQINQETRLFDTTNGITRAMRSKEDAHDYRYFPDPDLLPLTLSREYVDNISKTLPELPDQIRNRMVNVYGLSNYDAQVLTDEKETVVYYEKASEGRDKKLIANWMTVELFGALNKSNLTISTSPVNPINLANLVELIENKIISGKIAKDVFQEMFETGKNPNDIVEEKGLKQISDTSEVEKFIDQVLNDNKDKVEEYKSGKDKLFGFFVGQAMKESKGKGNPQLINKILKEKLNG